jgi:hypothetical protein
MTALEDAKLEREMRAVLFVALLAMLCVARPVVGLRSEGQTPRFADYPATDTFHGTPKAPVLSTKMARAFRTELRRQAASGPNFAGHFTLARWGCGAGCVTVAVIDAITGAVQFAPFAVEDAWKDGHIICHHGSDFELTSELFVAEGKVDDKIGRHYFRWHNRTFLLLLVERCST